MLVGGVGNASVSYRREVDVGNRASAATYVAQTRAREARRLLGNLQESVGEVTRTNPARRAALVMRNAPIARSQRPLGLRIDPRAATIGSSSEINATATTSFSPVAPTWEGASTAPVTVTGTYDGDQGTDTLEVVVTRVRANGRRDLSLRDGTGAEIERVVIGRREPDGAPQNLSNGLVLSFATRTMVVGDRFTIDVTAGTPQTANPDGAFDAVGPGGPNFDANVSVSAGAFTVNGTTIDVAADDTIDTVLARITRLTDVTATFDAASDAVVLTQKSTGAGPTIALGSDTSGFLAAVKLDTATLRPGDSGEHTMPIDDVDSLARIRPGRFWIDETRVRRIDPSVESLVDVLGLIDDVPGVSAGYILSRDRVAIRGRGDVLHIDDPRTRFFETVGIDVRDHFGLTDNGLAGHVRRDVTSSVRSMVRDISKLLRLSSTEGAGLAGFEDSFNDLIDAMDEDGALSAIGVGRRVVGQTGLRFGETEIRLLERALRNDPEGTLTLLFGDGQDQRGFVSQLATVTEAAISIADR